VHIISVNIDGAVCNRLKPKNFEEMFKRGGDVDRSMKVSWQ